VLPRKENDDETDQMIWHNHDQNEGGGAVDSCEACVDTFPRASLSLICTKTKIPIILNNNNKKNYYEITTKPLKPRLNFLNGKCNEVNKKIKVPLELNNNNKKILKK
jgi:hypothetical protein